jgi:hypothetical protein
MDWKCTPVCSSVVKDEVKEEGVVGANAPNSSKSPFEKVYEILRGVDARVYRDLQATPQSDSALVIFRDRHGLEWMCDRARDMTLWLDEQFRTNQEKRDKRHRPVSRLVAWMKREVKPCGGRDPTENPTDRMLREAELADSQCADPA